MVFGVNTHRLNVNCGNRNDVRAVVFVEIIKVGGVLEVVCVAFAAFDNVVRDNVIGKGFDFKRDVLFGKNFLCFFKNFRVGSGRSGDCDFRSGKGSLVNRGVKSVCGIVNCVYDGAGIFLCNESRNLLAFESRLESLCVRGAFVAFFDGKNICVFTV